MLKDMALKSSMPKSDFRFILFAVRRTLTQILALLADSCRKKAYTMKKWLFFST